MSILQVKKYLLPSGPSQVIEQAMFTYSLPGKKELKIKTKLIKNQKKKLWC